MTALAHKILGNVVPNVSGLVQITDSPHEHGLLLDRQPGIPLIERMKLAYKDWSTSRQETFQSRQPWRLASSHAWGPPGPEYASRTLQVTGFLDRGLARITPVYFKHVAARLACGHDLPWRKVLLEVLRQSEEAKICSWIPWPRGNPSLMSSDLRKDIQMTAVGLQKRQHSSVRSRYHQRI
ncbi:hypothetical protein D6D02_04292 [Aureobasidium pullulans]|uniref:Uncharacterized protein n=1 Tax=Aureobasidium pullulans TaxID=5580 RepID=A0A4S8UZP2_AURPU|nr:hypothetical protein D6D26_03181 [Aureobasidium pullulans]THW26500.1 hypothetical protein D6D23_03401 [Aureobasidium pullulans]THW66913.1 hypothetical protein D6D20_00899 [Aureobasidium pullulans]THY08919.1 hypothetical protein D6D03_00723 [Aureobasidium pullulans]THY14473.1 hypothetical protein D6D02_04292 [Aureobasidium pullulans]